MSKSSEHPVVLKTWIGVDFDRTLATYTRWPEQRDKIGEPIHPMIERVKAWLAEGREVRIFTARISHDGTEERRIECQLNVMHIMNWCMEHFGRYLAITNTKDILLDELWDDRAITVEANTGKCLSPHPIGMPPT